MKYTIGFSRKVQTLPYENMEVTLTAEFDDEQTPMEYAKDTVVKKTGPFKIDPTEFAWSVMESSTERANNVLYLLNVIEKEGSK